MVKVEVNGESYYMDGYLKTNLDLLKLRIKDDWDFVILIDGLERAGKSKLGRQIAYYLDPTIDMNRIIMTAKGYEDWINNSSKYQAGIFDEAGGAFDSKTALTRANRKLCNLLKRKGNKNLFHVLCLPTFFELVPYLAIHRSICLLHVYTVENLKRGQYTFYERDKKKYLYLTGKQKWNYKCTRPNFRGPYTNFEPKWFNSKRYEKMKDEAEDESSTPDFTKSKLQRDSLIYNLYSDGMSVEKIREYVNKYSESPLTVNAIYLAINRVKPTPFNFPNS